MMYMCVYARMTGYIMHYMHDIVCANIVNLCVCVCV